MDSLNHVRPGSAAALTSASSRELCSDILRRMGAVASDSACSNGAEDTLRFVYVSSFLNMCRIVVLASMMFVH